MAWFASTYGGTVPKRTVKPSYPTRQQAERDLPAFLRQLHLDSPQLARLGLAGGLLFLGLAGCERSSRAADKEPDPETTFGQEKESPPFAGSATVAPVFVHGTGRAALGCVVVAPPAFLTEEEARTIIREELQKIGINCTEHDVKLDAIQIAKGESIRLRDMDGKTLPPEKAPLMADLVDPNKHITIEFVAFEDYHELGGKLAASTVQDFNFPVVASRLAEQIDHQNKDRLFGVFYEPVARAKRPDIAWPTDFDKLPKEKQEAFLKQYEAKAEEARKEAVQQSASELRKQVQDFAAWLKKRGVI